jgi:hypothetical protein
MEAGGCVRPRCDLAYQMLQYCMLHRSGYRRNTTMTTAQRQRRTPEKLAKYRLRERKSGKAVVNGNLLSRLLHHLRNGLASLRHRPFEVAVRIDEEGIPGIRRAFKQVTAGFDWAAETERLRVIWRENAQKGLETKKKKALAEEQKGSEEMQEEGGAGGEGGCRDGGEHHGDDGRVSVQRRLLCVGFLSKTKKRANNYISTKVLRHASSSSKRVCVCTDERTCWRTRKRNRTSKS